ncbi:acyl-CoA thioesterase domain-containing protein [Aurantiacibacter spongiae]|uniref:acyl-CoA thioesterase domain-containing protein n=1 Tax=Aurantiacibacter spongiae TaxID=2488860 RepID=UPI002D780DF7|nr:acyl-CoA thioesterase domain-containing protein [Aurantiacibacter spongiae]
MDDASWIGPPGPGIGPRMFGGHALAQALLAAELAESGQRAPHSLHAYFLEPGATAAPTRYDVTTLVEGRSFAKKRIEASQGTRPS